MNSIFDLVSDSVFDLPNPSPMTKLVKKCMPYTEDEKNLTRWQVKNPRTDEFDLELPKCVFVCEEEPPFDNKIQNRTWRDGFKGEGEIAKYRCLGKEKNNSSKKISLGNKGNIRIIKIFFFKKKKNGGKIENGENREECKSGKNIGI